MTRQARPPADRPEEGSGLVIGDAVELDLPVARAASRGIARLIDVGAQIILGLFVWFLLWTLAGLSGALDRATAEVITVVVEVLVFAGYPVTLETLTRGRTLGKLAMGLRVVRDDGGAIRFRQALTRGLVGAAAEWPGLIPPITWLVSLACMQSDPRSRRLGDMTAGTMVVHERTPIVWGWIPVMPPHLASWAQSLDLGGVTDELAMEMRQYLIRYRFLTDRARIRLGTELTVEVAACIKPLPPPGVTGRDFLIAVLAERHRRSVIRIARARTATATVWPELMAAAGQGAWVPNEPAAGAAPAPVRSSTPPARAGT